MKKAYYGGYGGQFVPETLMPVLEELEVEFGKAKKDRKFMKELEFYQREYVGRPSLLYRAPKLSSKYSAKVYLKREDLNHTGAHKINNCIGQALLAKRMGKTRIIAETGAGQHGVAAATAAALLGLECVVYMGAEDVERQKLNVYRMQLLGSKVVTVNTGAKTLKNAVNAALRDYTTNFGNTHYLIGSVVGPHPFPKLVAFFSDVVGREARRQIIQKEGKLPHYVIACVGGGSNAAGIFIAFLKDRCMLVGVEAAGKGIKSGAHCATLGKGQPGVLHGSKSYLLQDKMGQVADTHSISAGLDYPGVGPLHSFLKDSGRARYVSITDEEALRAFHSLSELEGIIPALESAHAVAQLEKMKKEIRGKIVIVNLSGRGDKDVQQVAAREGVLI